MTSTASATNNAYCGILIANGTWCGDGSNHSWVFNSASYTGGGSVWVCERLLIADTSTQRENPVCGYTYVSASFGSYIYLTEAEVSHWTGANHTIYGLSTY
ncbi:MAG TPA: hypothetical protein VFG42_21090 [Baekduia sp.]|uniref:hypothetical protein n=1 Tax=Baekduia sp. TaxID=2600305 RepID=UPI002D7735A3|nr:hypothetical protein [Baekduia sp.]HET6509306.1 hypothetical protein [Baekduia sp.]